MAGLDPAVHDFLRSCEDVDARVKPGHDGERRAEAAVLTGELPVKILYFAWLRTKIGLAEEQVDLPENVGDVAALLRWLQGRGAGFAEALKDLSVVRVAVNQDYVKTDHKLRPGDEVALFPPVTGG
jgi:sulfur-carrier protein